MVSEINNLLNNFNSTLNREDKISEYRDCCHAKSWPTLCDPVDCSMAPLSFTISQSLLRFMYTDSVMLSSHLIFCHPLLFLPSIFPSIRVFSNELALRTKKPKYWNFSISRSNEYSGLISFRVDWFDLLAIQGTLESLLQHYNLKASILQCSAFLMVQLSHLYMTTGKTIAFTVEPSLVAQMVKNPPTMQETWIRFLG